MWNLGKENEEQFNSVYLRTLAGIPNFRWIREGVASSPSTVVVVAGFALGSSADWLTRLWTV